MSKTVTLILFVMYSSNVLADNGASGSNADIMKAYNSAVKLFVKSTFSVDPNYGTVIQQSKAMQESLTARSTEASELFSGNIIESLTGVSIASTTATTSSNTCPLDIGKQIQTVYDSTLFPYDVLKPVDIEANLEGNSLFSQCDTLKTTAKKLIPDAIVLKNIILGIYKINSCDYPNNADCKVATATSLANAMQSLITSSLQAKLSTSLQTKLSGIGGLILSEKLLLELSVFNSLKGTLGLDFKKSIATKVTKDRTQFLSSGSSLDINSLITPDSYTAAKKISAKGFLQKIIETLKSTAQVLPSIPMTNESVLKNGEVITMPSLRSIDPEKYAQVKAYRLNASYEFEKMKKTYAAANNKLILSKQIALSNFYDMYARRAGNEIVTPNWRNENWVKLISTAYPGVVNKETTYLLADINYQLHENSLLLERILATDSMILSVTLDSSNFATKLEADVDKAEKLVAQIITGVDSDASSASTTG
jgi:hypothetical protein